MSLVVARFEWARHRRSALFLTLAFLVLILALFAGLARESREFSLPIAFEAWFTAAVPTAWSWIGGPVTGALLASVFTSDDLGSGALRMILVVPNVRRSLVIGKLLATISALLTLALWYFLVSSSIFVYAVLFGDADYSLRPLLSIGIDLAISLICLLPWVLLVAFIALKAGRTATAVGIAFSVLSIGWLLRSAVGPNSEPWLIPFWGDIVKTSPTCVIIGSLLLLSTTVVLLDRTARRLEVR